MRFPGQDDPVRREVLQLARPAIAQSLLQTMTFVVDRGMLGHHGASSIAALQIGGSIGWGLFIVATSFTAGTVAVVGRAVGARDEGAARDAARASLGIALAASVLAIAVGAGLTALSPIAFPEAGETVVGGARGYLAVILPSFPLLLVAIALASIVQASGDTRTPFLAGAFGNLLNLGLDWVFIFGRLGAPELGPAGAGIGTAASWFGQVVVLWALWPGLGRAPSLMPRRRGSSSRQGGPGGVPAAARRILRVTWPSTGERGVQAAGYFLYVGMIGALGETAMAAHQSLIALEALSWLSADGFGVAAGAVVAQRLGARAPGEARRGGWVATALAATALSLCGLVFLSFPDPLLAAFTGGRGELTDLAVPCLRIAALAQPFMAAAVVLSCALRAAGATGWVFGVALLGGVGVRLGVTGLAAFGLGLGLTGVWLGSTVDWIVRAGVLAWLFHRGAWARRLDRP